MRRDSRAELSADARERLARLLVALVREPHEAVRVGGRAEQLLRDPRRGDAGHVRLEVPAPVAEALARQAVGLDDDVPELRPAAVERCRR